MVKPEDILQRMHEKDNDEFWALAGKIDDYLTNNFVGEPISYEAKANARVINRIISEYSQHWQVEEYKPSAAFNVDTGLRFSIKQLPPEQPIW